MQKKYAKTSYSKHVVVISLDAVSRYDFEDMSALPRLSSLRREGVCCLNVSSVLPAQTYTVHTSIVTGTTPDIHGITNNHPVQPGIPDAEQIWYTKRSDIKALPIYDAAIERGLKTASFLWPVTENSKIKYNLPEIAPLPGENQIIRILKGGSTFFLLSTLLRMYKKVRTTQPGLDAFNTELAARTIRTKKPHLTLIHLTNVDTVKHNSGISREEVLKALKIVDEQVGQIIEAVKSAGIFDRTAFLIVSDHGQVAVSKRVRLNNVLARAGLISVDENNKIKDYRAYSQTAGNGALISIKDNDPEIISDTEEVLNSIAKDPSYGIKWILKNDEIRESGGGSCYTFIIQGEYGIHFDDDITGYMNYDDFEEQNVPYATHGYIPAVEKEFGIEAVFVAGGYGIKKGVMLDSMSVCDYAPTIAALLDIDNFNTGSCSGRVLKEILTKS